MKISLKIISAVGSVVILAFFCTFALFVYLFNDKVDTFYLLDASLSNPKYLYEIEDRLAKENAYKFLRETPPVYAHRLERGDGMIFAYRSFSAGNIRMIDDERFEKITIWLPETPSESVSNIDMSNRTLVTVVYTKGFPHGPPLHAPGI